MSKQQIHDKIAEVRESMIDGGFIHKTILLLTELIELTLAELEAGDGD
jgi:hypothetical protein